MVFKSRSIYIFTPVLKGNDKAPESSRMTAEILRPTADERGELSDLELVRDLSKKQIQDVKSEHREAKDNQPQKATVRFIRRQDTGRILREHVGKLSNVQVEEQDPSGKTVLKTLSTGADLADSTAFGISELVDELCAEVLRDKIDEDTAKN